MLYHCSCKSLCQWSVLLCFLPFLDSWSRKKFTFFTWVNMVYNFYIWCCYTNREAKVQLDDVLYCIMPYLMELAEHKRIHFFLIEISSYCLLVKKQRKMRRKAVKQTEGTLGAANQHMTFWMILTWVQCQLLKPREVINGHYIQVIVTLPLVKMQLFVQDTRSLIDRGRLS
jgi:hypothetical protein